jgi:SM-20-related protein
MSEREDAVLEVNQFESLIQGLIDDKYGSCIDFLMPITTEGLSAKMTALNVRGVMMAAGIGNNSDFHQDIAIRGDKVNWIEPLSEDQFEVIYLQKIWRFIAYLNKTCFTSIKTFESHYSSYDRGSFYKKHLDQFKNENGRKYSVVIYLNSDWELEDEGMLSLYPLIGEPHNISPIAGRMVFFKSDEMEHEVHPSFTRERRSIAGWLKN